MPEDMAEKLPLNMPDRMQNNVFTWVSPWGSQCHKEVTNCYSHAEHLKVFRMGALEGRRFKVWMSQPVACTIEKATVLFTLWASKWHVRILKPERPTRNQGTKVRQNYLNRKKTSARGDHVRSFERKVSPTWGWILLGFFGGDSFANDKRCRDALFDRKAFFREVQSLPSCRCWFHETGIWNDFWIFLMDTSMVQMRFT